MSKKNWFPKALLPALLMSAVLWACDFQGEASSPLAPVAGAEFSTSGNGYTVVKAEQSASSVSGSIGAAGGKLILGKHELSVPKNAVSEATTFTLTQATGELRFKLTATRVTTNDVGASGFAVPVTLTVSYEKGVYKNESALRIVWVRPDGTQEAQTTVLDLQGKRGSADLGHFSDYVMAEP